MLSTDNWCIKVNDKVYGPYTMGQMRAFHNEGRLGEGSLIAPAGGRAWRSAKHYPGLSDLLIHPAPDSSE